MLRLLFLSILVCFLFCPASGNSAQLNVKPMQTESDLPLSTTVPYSKDVAIIPHRAIYDLSLASAKNSSNVTGVSGRMMFEWGDTCDGWTVQQHMHLHFIMGESGKSNVTSTEVSWESKDGEKYNFNIRRVTDGKETEVFRGKATLGADGGNVIYSVPEGKTKKLPSGSLFPTSHTKLMIQKAAQGEKFFTRYVFDGSDNEGGNNVSAFVSSPVPVDKKVELSAALKDNDLLQATEWPIRLAYFKETDETGEPDFEMNLNLQSNGVAKTIRIDYSDFSVFGSLTALEPLSMHGCKEP